MMNIETSNNTFSSSSSDEVKECVGLDEPTSGTSRSTHLSVKVTFGGYPMTFPESYYSISPFIKNAIDSDKAPELERERETINIDYSYELKNEEFVKRALVHLEKFLRMKAGTTCKETNKFDLNPHRKLQNFVLQTGKLTANVVGTQENVDFIEEFHENEKIEVLFELLRMANYLSIDELTHLCAFKTGMLLRKTEGFREARMQQFQKKDDSDNVSASAGP